MDHLGLFWNEVVVAILGRRRLAVLVALLHLPLGSAAADDAAPWLADRNAAIAQARKQGKLLLFVQLSGDFAKNSANSTEARAYQGIALADPRVAKELAGRFVLHYQNVGEAESLRKLTPAKALPPRPEFAVTYVCLPDLRVIHFVPGFLSSGELLAELAWAEKCYALTAGLSEAEELLAIRKAHLAAVVKADLPLFERGFKSRWTAEGLASGPSTVELPATLAAARGGLELSLVQRLGKSWQKIPSQDALAALAAHGSLAREMSHVLLSEFPLTPLGDLERLAYECGSKERFWQATRRRETLAAWWKKEVAASRPLLLVVADDPAAKPGAEATALVWPPAKTDTLPLLAKFAVEVVSLDELATLLADAKQTLNYPAAELPRFVLFAAGGKLAGHLDRTTSPTRLAQAMSAAAGAEAAPASGVNHDPK